MYIIQSSLLTLNGRNDLSRVPTSTELKVPNSLPGTGRQTTIGNGDADRGTNESGLDMSLSVV
jgi:hypothetical protein